MSKSSADVVMLGGIALIGGVAFAAHAAVDKLLEDDLVDAESAARIKQQIPSPKENDDAS